MKPSVIREMGQEELEHKQAELREQLFRLRLQHSLGQLDNTLKVRHVRRDIARVNTILRQRQVSR
jgi:large subunit ribosomal protein L29